MGPDSVWYISEVDLIMRMSISVLLGGIIGIEREWSNQSAGFRTHILVCLGSTTIMLLSMYGFSQFTTEEEIVRMDPARLAAQVISGIGFLGAGAILRNGNIVKGLTTAASIWVVAGIGLCVGAGFLVGAFYCTFLCLVSLFLLNKWEKHWTKKNLRHEVEIKMIEKPGSLEQVTSMLIENGIKIVDVEMEMNFTYDEEKGKKSITDIRLTLKKCNSSKCIEVLDQISSMDMILEIKTYTKSTAKKINRRSVKKMKRNSMTI